MYMFDFRNGVSRDSQSYRLKSFIFRQILLIFIDLADYVKFLFYICENKTHEL